MRIAAATPTPIPAAAPLESPNDVPVLGVEVVLEPDVGADMEGVVDAGTEEDVEEVEEEDNEVEVEVAVAITL